MTIDEKRVRIPFPPIPSMGLSDLDLQKKFVDGDRCPSSYVLKHPGL
jgi:hypothetical protein